MVRSGNQFSGIRAAYELSDNAGTRRNAHLPHDKAYENLHSVWADVHSLPDFLACQPICEMLYRFNFTLTKFKSRRQVAKNRAFAFQNECDSGLPISIEFGFQKNGNGKPTIALIVERER